MQLSTKQQPTVSIISCIYDADRFINNFMKNITSQSVFDKCELILINPVSPGNEKKIIEPYLTKYPNIIYKELEQDPGLYEVWNTAIRMARGKYITNANPDDRRAPEHIKQHIEILENDPTIDMVSSPTYTTKVADETWEDNSAYDIWQMPYSGNIGFETFFTKDSKEKVQSYNPAHCMPVWRKNLHMRFGWFDEDSYGPHSDWEFWLRCSEYGAKYYMLPEPLGLYLFNPKSHNRRFPIERDLHKKIVAEYYEKSRHHIKYRGFYKCISNLKQLFLLFIYKRNQSMFFRIYSKLKGQYK